jgi:hypothetical protein
VGIQEAADLAKQNGCELPTPALVDAIWKHADLRIQPRPQQFKKWTLAEMTDPEVYKRQQEYIDSQLDGKTWTLIAGTHKDIVAHNKKLGLYGWHQLNGKPIQPFYSGHTTTHKDYSQGLRLTKKVEQ